MAAHIKLLLGFIIIITIAGCGQQDTEGFIRQGPAVENEIYLLAGLDSALPAMVSSQDINHCRQALALAKTNGNERLELSCLVRLFELQNKSEDYRDALHTGRQALELAEAAKSKTQVAEIHKLFGQNYYHLSVFHKSFESFEKSLLLFRQLGDTSNQIHVLNMQGNIYFNWEDSEMAFEYYEHTFSLARSLNDHAAIAKALTNMGVVFALRSHQETISEDSSKRLSDQAVQHIQNAIRFVDKTDNKLMRAEILNNLAITCQERGELEKAHRTILEAKRLSKTRSDRVYCSASLSYASILLAMDSVERAENELQKTLQLAREKELKAQIINILGYLSDISADKNNFSEAYKYQKEHSAISDSVFNLDYKKKIDAIKVAGEMENLIQQQKLRQQGIFYQTLIIVTGLVFVILIITLLYSRTRIRNKNIRLENKLLSEGLETRNKELATRIMALIQRNELEKEIVQKLYSLRPKMKKENQGDVSEIINSLSYKQNDQLWKEFEIRFENVHQEFFNKLARQFPDLTTNEKRLCAFLYLDMSSKDISAITGQSIRALNVARTRLRKKFSLTNETQSISAFLNSL